MSYVTVHGAVTGSLTTNCLSDARRPSHEVTHEDLAPVIMLKIRFLHDTKIIIIIVLVTVCSNKFIMLKIIK